MADTDKIKRAFVFYFSVVLYFVLLPLVLSSSLGYKIDYHAMRITRTGIIFLKSEPSGALVTIDGNEYSAATPVRVEDLKPGKYNVALKKEGFYTWQKELVVNPNMVTRADDVVLFPVLRDLKRMYGKEIIDFAISNRNVIYYMSTAGLFRANIDGTNVKKLTSYGDWPWKIYGKIFSPDGEKMLFFNDGRIWVIYLNENEKPGVDKYPARVEEILKTNSKITCAFWFSQSNYIIFVCGKDINVAELSGQGVRNIVTIYRFKDDPESIHYDQANDTLYFIDKESYLYRLDLREKFFDQLMNIFRKELDMRREKK